MSACVLTRRMPSSTPVEDCGSVWSGPHGPLLTRRSGRRRAWWLRWKRRSRAAVALVEQDDLVRGRVEPAPPARRAAGAGATVQHARGVAARLPVLGVPDADADADVTPARSRAQCHSGAEHHHSDGRSLNRTTYEGFTCERLSVPGVPGRRFVRARWCTSTAGRGVRGLWQHHGSPGLCPVTSSPGIRPNSPDAGHTAPN